MEIKQTNQPKVSATNNVDTDAGKAASSAASQTTRSEQTGSVQTVRQVTKQMQNSSILAAQESVSIASGDQSMALLYRAAIEAINEELAPTLGENAIQKGVEAGVDYTPEATAERIVSFATNFFSVHQGQTSNLEFNEQLDGFMEIISGAIDQGFEEAKEILDGLSVLDGDIAAGVEQTYELVQQGLAKFREQTLEANQPSQDTPVDEANAQA
ncbi:hypothetical protein G3R49_12270 [Shewanella sp. WXL01]|uniref:DUF5610 domain-containing protein n=1 Tax=Shewanella sp. WXL01 TaxID=2709721 RepID=UPI0014386931|nr:DUF5610 domain-containing protein [Shewanella sp. WXL01]NKF51332.1 hypothetical protein [Shewanella sp. WXL01]